MIKLHILSLFIFSTFLFVACEKETADVVVIEEGFPPSVELITANLFVNIEDIDGTLNDELSVSLLHEGVEIGNATTEQGVVELINQPIHEDNTLIKVESSRYLPNYLTQDFESAEDHSLSFTVKEFDEITPIDIGDGFEYQTNGGFALNMKKDDVSLSNGTVNVKASIIEQSNEIETLFGITKAIDKEGVLTQLNIASLFYFNIVTEASDPVEVLNNISFQIINEFDLNGSYQLWYFSELAASWNEVEISNLTKGDLSFEHDGLGYFALSFTSNCTDDIVAPIAVCDLEIHYDYDQNGDGFIYPSDLDEGSHDDCSNISYEISKPIDSCADNSDEFSDKISICAVDVGTNLNVLLKVTDEANNTSICHSNIIVTGSSCSNDMEAPIAVCDSDLTYNYSSQGDGFIYAQNLDDGSYDNCSALVYEVKKSNDSCNDGSDEFTDKISICAADAGTNILATLKVTDMSGNSNLCIVNVFVEDFDCNNDVIAPVLSLRSELTASFSNATTIWPQDFDMNTYDNCTSSSDLLFQIAKETDVCNNGSDVFSNNIELCSDEINTNVKIVILVSDKSGNFTTGTSILHLEN